MSQPFDIDDAALDLNLEVLSLIADSDDGLSTEEIYQRSDLAMDKQMVSKTVGGLRTQGKVSSIINSGNVRVFIITDKGRDTIYGKETTERISIDDSDLLTKLDKKGKKSSKKENGTSKATNILTGLLPLRSLSGLRCMLASDGTFVMDVASTTPGEAGQHLELTPEQTKHLWYYLAQLYPKIVTLKVCEDKS